jgi:hypothetical protein
MTPSSKNARTKLRPLSPSPSKQELEQAGSELFRMLREDALESRLLRDGLEEALDQLLKDDPPKKI